jgi:hypothetical protein
MRASMLHDWRSDDATLSHSMRLLKGAEVRSARDSTAQEVSMAALVHRGVSARRCERDTAVR